MATVERPAFALPRFGERSSFGLREVNRSHAGLGLRVTTLVPGQGAGGPCPRRRNSRVIPVATTDHVLGAVGHDHRVKSTQTPRRSRIHLVDRVTRAALRVGLGRRGTALIETVGRTSGQPRVTPVTNGLDGDVFWIVSEHGHSANYVRNIIHDPKVRVNCGRDWRTGTAQIVAEDPQTRLEQIVTVNPRARANAAIVRRRTTDNLVIRVDLDK